MPQKQTQQLQQIIQQEGGSLAMQPVEFTLAWSVTLQGQLGQKIHVRGSQSSSVPLSQLEEAAEREAQEVSEKLTQQFAGALQTQMTSAQELMQRYGQQRRTA